MDTTYDGGYIFGGSRQFGISSTDCRIVLLKTKSDGTPEWEKYFDLGYFSYLTLLKQTNDSGFLCIGLVQAPGRDGDILAIKTDANGNLQWTNSYNSTWASAPGQLTEEPWGYVISGEATWGVEQGALLFKINHYGQLIWSQLFVDPASQVNCESGTMVKSFDHLWIHAGDFDGGGFSKYLIIKSDTQGILQWRKCYNDTASSGERVIFIMELPDHRLLYVSNRADTHSNNNIGIFMTDADGQLLWSKSFGVPGGYVYPLHVIRTHNDRILVAGDYRDSALSNNWASFLAEFTLNGRPVRAKVHGGSVMFQTLAMVETNNGITLAGRGYCNGHSTAMMVRTDSLFRMACGDKDLSIRCDTVTLFELFPGLQSNYIGEFLCSATAGLTDTFCSTICMEKILADTLPSLTSSSGTNINSVYAPNAFTPNDDGLNDIFYIHGENIAELDLAIFDRWGECIYHSSGTNCGWDGTYKGKKVDSSVFIYKVNGSYLDGSGFSLIGHVSVIR